MKIGMLWFDNDPKAELKVKIERAASYYSKKYGQAPNLCFIHPSMILSVEQHDGIVPSGEGAHAANSNGNGNGNGNGAAHGKGNGKHGSIEIRTNRSVLPNHFWIGLSEAAADTQAG
jgi:hypothetical protein